jgi:cell surface protein SprA
MIRKLYFFSILTKVERHDFEIEDYVDQQASSSVDCDSVFNLKPIEPFKKMEFMKKERLLEVTSDFNFNYLPSNISFNTNISADSIIVNNLGRWMFRELDWIRYIRRILFNYRYGFNYNLTKSLKLNYTASSGIVKKYLRNRTMQANR